MTKISQAVRTSCVPSIFFIWQCLIPCTFHWLFRLYVYLQWWVTSRGGFQFFLQYPCWVFKASQLCRRVVIFFVVFTSIHVLTRTVTRCVWLPSGCIQRGQHAYSIYFKKCTFRSQRRYDLIKFLVKVKVNVNVKFLSVPWMSPLFWNCVCPFCRKSQYIAIGALLNVSSAHIGSLFANGIHEIDDGWFYWWWAHFGWIWWGRGGVCYVLCVLILWFDLLFRKFVSFSIMNDGSCRTRHTCHDVCFSQKGQNCLSWSDTELLDTGQYITPVRISVGNLDFMSIMHPSLFPRTWR